MRWADRPATGEAGESGPLPPCGESFVGTVANGSVDLAPFHNLDSRVPQQLKAELSLLTTGIKNGGISVNPRDYLPN